MRKPRAEEGGRDAGSSCTASPWGVSQVRTERLVVVIVIVPVVLGAPLVRIFIPPPLVVVPAKGPRSGQFLSPVFGFGTLGAILFDGFMQIVIGLDGALLTIVISVNNIRGGEEHGSRAHQGC